MKIGNVHIRGKLALAPMAQVTTLPFRLLCRRYGCSLVYSEMLCANPIVRNNRATMRKAFTCDEQPIAMQIFGTQEELMLEAALKLGGDIIDVNLGCPSVEVMKQGAGAALLKRPEKIGSIIKYLAENLDKPVTAKIRIGLDKTKVNAVEVAKIVEEAGGCAIAVHGRTVKQKYTGKADWSVIRDVKDAVGIPVIANGDVVDEESAAKCLEESGADMLMIGRGAVGNPYVFKRIDRYLKTGKILAEQSKAEKLSDFFEYVNLAQKYGMLRCEDLKRHAQDFTKGVSGGKTLRKQLSSARTVARVVSLMNDFRTQII
ncbi:MAG: tRNA dihydrouridine synthase DusB [Candidatus Woesearchaeota archaeon]